MVDIDEEDDEFLSHTALHEAAIVGDPAIVEALIHRGANVNAQDEHSKTLLHYASSKGYLAVVQPLLQAPGVEINKKACGNQTPLHETSQNGHLAVVQALLAVREVDVDAEDSNRWPPLHLAAMWGYLAVVEELIRKGANKTLKNDIEETPLSLVPRGNDYNSIRDLLSE